MSSEPSKLGPLMCENFAVSSLTHTDFTSQSDAPPPHPPLLNPPLGVRALSPVTTDDPPMNTSSDPVCESAQQTTLIECVRFCPSHDELVLLIKAEVSRALSEIQPNVRINKSHDLFEKLEGYAMDIIINHGWLSPTTIRKNTILRKCIHNPHQRAAFYSYLCEKHPDLTQIRITGVSFSPWYVVFTEKQAEAEVVIRSRIKARKSGGFP